MTQQEQSAEHCSDRQGNRRNDIDDGCRNLAAFDQQSCLQRERREGRESADDPGDEEQSRCVRALGAKRKVPCDDAD